MTIHVNKTANAIDVFLEEACDAPVADELRYVIEEIINNTQADITFHFSTVGRMDSSGIGALIFLHRRLLLQGRRMRLDGLGGQPLELVRLIRLDRAIECVGMIEARDHRPSLVAAISTAARAAMATFGLRPASSRNA